MTKMLEDFIKYAKEEFGYTITCEESSTPDTFETFFGNYFVENTDDIIFSDTFYNQLCENKNTNFDMSETNFSMDFELQKELFYAA